MNLPNQITGRAETRTSGSKRYEGIVHVRIWGGAPRTTPAPTRQPNCRPASPLEVWREFGRAGHARPCVSGGSPLSFVFGE